MAINTGVDISKFVAYAVVAPPVGVDITKFNAYTVLGPIVGVDITKLQAYAVLAVINVNPPVWPAFDFGDGYVGILYSQAWDMPSSALTVTYSVLSGSLPPGLALSALGSNQAKISGTPTTIGTYTFTLRATNTYGTADQAFSITIHNVSLVVPVGEILQSGVQGTAYSETISVQGGTSPYTFAVTAGALPTSLSLNTSTGVISGTPSATGTFTFIIEVTDSDTNVGTQAFQIDVIAASGSSGGGSWIF